MLESRYQKVVFRDGVIDGDGGACCCVREAAARCLRILIIDALFSAI